MYNETDVRLRYSGAMEIARFLSRYPPFDSLTIDENERIAGQLQIEFFPKGSTILRQAGEPAAFMYIVRKGSVELTSDGVVFDQLLEGECFGHPSLLSALGPAFNVAATEDTLCYLLPSEEVKRLLATGAGLTFLAESLRHRTEQVFGGHVQTAFDRSMTHVGSLLHRPPVICDSAASIQTAAELMRREHISSVIVPWRDQIGVMTDRDLRSRVVAPGRDPAEPVAAVMSFPARTIDEEATVAEVLLLMLDIGVHHLPVVGTDGTLIGVITDTDLMGLGLQAPFAIRNAIARAEDLEAAVAAMRKLPGAVTELLEASVDPLGIGHTISATIDALTRRLLRFAIRELGEPPVPWAWLALGSQARREQGLRTDQDHAIVYEAVGAANEGADGYFEGLARRVTDGLELAGIPPCRGGVMASEPDWRQSREEWVARFASWADKGDRGARVFTAIAFDYRRIDGPLEIEADLDRLIRKAGRESFAVKRIAQTAIDQHPPTGFRGNLIVQHGGEHVGSLNIKHGGITPIVSLARALAVAAGVSANATMTRLDGARASELIDDQLYTGLGEAYRFLWQVRVEHQVRLDQSGVAADDFVDPAALGPLARQGLKESFRLISRSQSALAKALEFRLP